MLIVSLAWLAWFIYWRISAFRVKATERRESLLSRATYTVPTVIAVVLFVLSRGWPGWLTLHVVPTGSAGYWTGVVLLLAGLGFCCWARAILGANWSGSVTLKRGHELIRSGPYRWVRHPIYTGLITALLGTAIVQAQVRSFIALVLLTGAFVYKLGVEERMLSELFAKEYARYRQEVAALIPCVF